MRKMFLVLSVLLVGTIGLIGCATTAVEEATTTTVATTTTTTAAGETTTTTAAGATTTTAAGGTTTTTAAGGTTTTTAAGGTTTTTAGGTTTTTAGGTTTTTTTTTSTTTTSTTTTTTSTTTTTTVPSYSISGTVKFASTSAGVKGGVTIGVTGPETRTVTSDATTGAYEVILSGGGTYTLEAVKTNWNTSTETVAVTGATTRDFSLSPTSWEVIRTGNQVLYYVILGAWGQSYSNGIAAGSSESGGYALYTTNGGGSWTATAAPSIDPAVTGWSNYIVTPAGYTATFESSGAQWIDVGMAISPPTGKLYSCFAPLNASDWFCTTQDGLLYKSTSGFPPSWSLISVEGNPVLNKVGGLPGAITSINTFEVVGNAGKAYRTTNGGTSWTVDNILGTQQDLMTIVAGGSNGIVVSSQGSIFWYDGANWTEDLTGVPYALNDAWTMGSLSGSVVVGNNGLILKRN